LTLFIAREIVYCNGMSEPKYSDDDIERLAKRTGDEFKRHFDTYVEQSEERDKAIWENIEAMLDRRLKPLEAGVAELQQDMKTVKLAVAETNRDLRTVKRRTEKLEQYTEDTASLMIRVTALEEAHRS